MDLIKKIDKHIEKNIVMPKIIFYSYFLAITGIVTIFTNSNLKTLDLNMLAVLGIIMIYLIPLINYNYYERKWKKWKKTKN